MRRIASSATAWARRGGLLILDHATVAFAAVATMTALAGVLLAVAPIGRERPATP